MNLKDLLSRKLISENDITKLNNAEKNYKSNPNYKLEDIWLDSKGEPNTNAIEEFNLWFRENTWEYRQPVQKWINTQYQDLMKLPSDDPRVDFYKYIKTTSLSIESSLPFDSRLKTKLPGVLKTTRERIISKNNSIVDVLYHSVVDNFKVLEDDTERGISELVDESGNPVHFIPIYFTNTIGSKFSKQFNELPESSLKVLEDKYRPDYEVVKPDQTLAQYIKTRYIQDETNLEQSYDVGGIYYKYFASAIKFKHYREILPKVEMAKYILDNRKVAVTKQGKQVSEYGSDKNKVVTIEGKTSNVSAQFSDWVDQIFYGLKENDLGKIFGIDVSKTIKRIGKFTALNMLGVNFIQGFANVATGTAMQWMEGIGGEHYTPANMLKARKIYLQNLSGILADVGKRSPSNMIGLLNESFDILNEYDEGEFRKNSKFKQLLGTNSLFFTSHAGEHWMQTQTLLAMLDKVRALDSKGNDLGSMLDNIKVHNGHLVYESKDGVAVANFNRDQQALLESKVRRKLSSMHGEYSELGRIAIQRSALLSQVLMFRKFIVPGVKRRYGRKQVNNLMRETVEGNYLTTLNFFKNLYTEGNLFKFGLYSTDWNNLLDKEKANIRKTIAELAFMTSAIILSWALLHVRGEEDDPNENWLLSFLSYQALRFKAEMWFFSNPLQTMKLLRSPAASISMLENSLKLFGQVMPPDFAGFDKYERGPMKGHYKIFKTIDDLTPVSKQFYRLMYPDELVNWLK